LTADCRSLPSYLDENKGKKGKQSDSIGVTGEKLRYAAPLQGKKLFSCSTRGFVNRRPPAMGGLGAGSSILVDFFSERRIPTFVVLD